jgi:hypothetical protein
VANRRELGYVSSWNTVGVPTDAPYGVATGGTSSSITVGGINYTLLTFTSDANLVVSTAGLFDVFLIGGGGGSWNNAGGSGPGGIATSTIYLPAATHAVDVGAGGAGNTVGLSSTIGVTTLGAHVAPIAIGGGFGGTPITGCGSQGGAGAVGVIPSMNPFSGGAANTNAGGGGAGGGGNGGAAPSNGVGGAGGPGFDVSVFIGGSTLLKCGGGGGGATVTGGAGGTGGGGVGASNTGAGAGVANTGGGAGGIWFGTVQAGGSGIVYVRFKV